MAGGRLTADLVAAVTRAVRYSAPVALVAGVVALAGIAAPGVLGDAVGSAALAAEETTAAEEHAACLRRYRWQPQVQREECGKPQAAASEETATAGTPTIVGEEIGRATVVIKTVTGEMAGEIRPIVPKHSVHQDEVIQTGGSSASEIVFRDDTRVSLGPNTRLSLDAFVFDPDPARGKFVMSTGKGAVRFVSGNLAKQSYAIRTPTVDISVHGTTISVVTNDAGVTAVVLECPACGGYQWQPEKQRQCLAEEQKGVTLESASGQTVKLQQCNECNPFLPDGTLVYLEEGAHGPGSCPDWARDAIDKMDDLVGQPQGGLGPVGEDPEANPPADPPDDPDDPDDPSDDPPDDPADDDDGNRSGFGDGSNPGKGSGSKKDKSNEGENNPGKSDD